MPAEPVAARLNDRVGQVEAAETFKQKLARRAAYNRVVPWRLDNHVLKLNRHPRDGFRQGLIV